MTGPRSGSRLYAASWASPTDSKTMPTTHSATPGQTSDGHQHRREAGHLQRQGDEPDRHALDEEDLAHGEAEAAVARASRRTAGPRGVASWRWRMCHASRPPQSADQHQQQPAPPQVAVADEQRDEGDERRARSPRSTSTTETRPTRRATSAVTVIATAATASETPRTSDHTCAPRAVVSGGPGRTARIWSTPMRPSRNASPRRPGRGARPARPPHRPGRRPRRSGPRTWRSHAATVRT